MLQVIALNSSQAAEGELYIDDGRSFDFKEGAYIHRRFIFSAGTLTSLNLAASSGSKKYASECRVERIIVLGLSSGAKAAIVEPGKEKVEVEKGPLLLRASQGPSVITIRKPNVRVGDDWSIKIL